MPEEFDGSLDAKSEEMQILDFLPNAKSIRTLELFEDGFVRIDSASYHLDLSGSNLRVARRFDPILAGYGFDPLELQKESTVPSEIKFLILETLAHAPVRKVPRCNPFSAEDGGYGGRFVTIIDSQGQEHTLGSSDRICAESDHQCVGNCLSETTMTQLFSTLSSLLPLPVKPETRYTCAPDSPVPCGTEKSKELLIYGDWQNRELRGDVRLALADRLCSLEAFQLERLANGNWQVFNSRKESVGIISINSSKNLISCIERANN